jgi:transcriptional regulator with XRE-family HTH domain
MNRPIFEAARSKAGLSLRETARKVGVSHVSLIYWRNGTASPTLAHARKLAEVLRVDFGALWGGP